MAMYVVSEACDKELLAWSSYMVNAKFEIIPYGRKNILLPDLCDAGLL